MPLKDSHVNRAGKGDSGRYEVELGGHDLSELGLGGSMHFDFDLGSHAKHEKLRLHIGSRDFDDIAEIMIEVDEKAALKAFAKAIQRMPYLSKNKSKQP